MLYTQPLAHIANLSQKMARSFLTPGIAKAPGKWPATVRAYIHAQNTRPFSAAADSFRARRKNSTTFFDAHPDIGAFFFPDRYSLGHSSRRKTSVGVFWDGSSLPAAMQEDTPETVSETSKPEARPTKRAELNFESLKRFAAEEYGEAPALSLPKAKRLLQTFQPAKFVRLYWSSGRVHVFDECFQKDRARTREMLELERHFTPYKEKEKMYFQQAGVDAIECPMNGRKKTVDTRVLVDLCCWGAEEEGFDKVAVLILSGRNGSHLQLDSLGYTLRHLFR